MSTTKALTWIQNGPPPVAYWKTLLGNLTKYTPTLDMYKATKIALWDSNRKDNYMYLNGLVPPWTLAWVDWTESLEVSPAIEP